MAPSERARLRARSARRRSLRRHPGTRVPDVHRRRVPREQPRDRPRADVPSCGPRRSPTASRPTPPTGTHPSSPSRLVPLTLLPGPNIVFAAILIGSLPASLWFLGVRDWRCYGVVFLWPPVMSAVQTENVTLLLLLGSGRSAGMPGIAGAPRRLREGLPSQPRSSAGPSSSGSPRPDATPLRPESPWSRAP